MKWLLNVLIVGAHRRLFGALLWLILFTVLVAGLLAIGAHHVHSLMRADALDELAQAAKLRANVTTAFEKLRTEVTADACSPDFVRQLRRVAFAPDGLNEFLYAPGGVVQCSTGREHFELFVALGTPDVTGETRFANTLWFDRPLDGIGLKGVTATVAHAEPFGIVIPQLPVDGRNADWLRKELVVLSLDGRSWHRGGQRETYARATIASSAAGLSGVVCDEDRFHCIGTETSLADITRVWSGTILIALALSALVAGVLASRARTAIQDYWSFENRFCRNLTERRVVCVYQPIMDVRTGAISGCEALARWRDVNGAIVSPDKFIPLVDDAGLTRLFTKMVVDNAYRELAAVIPAEARLMVNFNVFPRDLDSEWLIMVFQPFVQDPRFDVVVEIVESDEVAIDIAQHEIEVMAWAGIKTYIDDFGAGYSNIHNLASLAVNGVKLDRGFAMAPDNSMMAKMLVHVLDMVETSGRALLVEGVETRERFEVLRATGKVDYIQGYLVSRPVPAGDFANLLAAHSPARWNERLAA